MTIEERVKALVDQIPAIEAVAETERLPGDTALAWVVELQSVVRAHYGEHSQTFDEATRQMAFFRGRNTRVNQAWAVLKGIATSLQRDLGMVDPNVLAKSELRREGFFLDGQTFDALYKISGFIRSATSSINLIDGYMSPDLLNLLGAKQTGVAVRIITKDLDPNTRTHALAFRHQYGPLEIRGSQAFHDRFLIIDRTDCYHFGASLKDAGKRAFMFSHIEEADIVVALLKKWDDEWNNGSVIV
jgi:hypothetical protein